MVAKNNEVLLNPTTWLRRNIHKWKKEHPKFSCL
jgi:hypothetical protein